MRTFVSLMLAAVLGLSPADGTAQAENPFDRLADQVTGELIAAPMITDLDRPDQSEALLQPARLSVKNVGIVEALQELGKRSGVPLVFSPSILPAISVSCDCAENSVGEALEQLLEGTDLEFLVHSSQVIVAPSNNPPDYNPTVPVAQALAVRRGLDRPLLSSLPTTSSSLPRSTAPRVGRLTGSVTDRDTGEPLATVQISIEGTGLGTISNTDGEYAIENVPAGTYTVVAQRIGYSEIRQTDVLISSGESTSLDLTMATTFLALQEVVATGLVDPVAGVRSPISVSRISRAQMPVPVAGSAVQNLQGRVAGVTMARVQGEPGEDITMMLRTPTSVTGSAEPLIVVDGVILGTGTGSANIESMDIESVEVVRGAAAASLYGSRAAAGVIAITTSRGSEVDMGTTRISVRSELGRAQAITGDPLPTHHQYLVDDPANPTTYVDFDGNPVDRANRVAPPSHLAFMDNPYPGPIFDNFRNVWGGGDFSTQSVSLMQNQESTNFALNWNRYLETGALSNNRGYERHSFRVNVDHRFLDDFTLATSVFHSRDDRDNASIGARSAFEAPPDIDLRARDPEGGFARVPDPMVPFENPLWVQESREADRQRVRTLASARLNWDFRYWLTLAGNISYDRQDQSNFFYLPKGTPLSVTQDQPADGEISFVERQNDTWNAEVQVSFRESFGALNTRTTFRAVYEDDTWSERETSAVNFFVRGVPRIDAAADRDGSSFREEVLAEGYLWDTAVDYGDRYIGTVLVRRDGSSLFGPDNRWHNYYRAAFAWRVGEEDWFNVGNVDEFKLGYARGTAGGRPGFAAQYETWSVSPSGVSKATLGNRDLRPEHTLEQEVSIEAILLERIGVDLRYAWQETTDQLVQVSIPAVSGFNGQWQNVGTVTGNTVELTVEAQVVQTSRFGWHTQFLFDRSRSKIADWPIPCQSPIWKFWCAGEDLFGLYNSSWATRAEQIAFHRGGEAAAYEDEFMVNDDGWLVWVGSGNHYTDRLWGESRTIGSETYEWGMPFFVRDEGGAIIRGRQGTMAHQNFGWVNSFRVGQLSLHAHLHGRLGGETINQLYRTLRLVDREPQMDQSGKPDELKKPVGYYHLLEGGRGTNALTENSDFLKLRALQLSYQLGQEQLTRFGLARMGFESLSLGVIGRNLLTVTPCQCADPEQGMQLNILRGDLTTTGFYPPSRSITFEIGATF